MEDRTPMILVPCGHSLCQADLVRLSSSNCPTCKTVIRGPVRNYALLTLLETAKTMYGLDGAGLIPKCEVHPTVSLEFWCEECRIVICPKCYLIAHKSHTMVGVDEAFKVQQGSEVNKALELGDLAIVKAQVRVRQSIPYLVSFADDGIEIGVFETGEIGHLTRS